MADAWDGIVRVSVFKIDAKAKKPKHYYASCTCGWSAPNADSWAKAFRDGEGHAIHEH